MEKYECEVNIDDDGSCTILGTDQDALDSAKEYVDSYNLVPEIGSSYDGVVVKILDFGAFVKIAPGKEGLLHISELRAERVEKVEDVLKVGEKITVKLMKIDDNNRLNFSIKALEKKQHS